MDFFYTKIENSEPAAARIGIKGHAPLSQFLNSSFILQLRKKDNTYIYEKSACIIKKVMVLYMSSRKTNVYVAQLDRAHAF